MTLARAWLQEMTWPEIEALVSEIPVVMLPLGSTEQHGPHLPEGTDTYVPAHLAEAIAWRTGVPVAPPLWFTTCEQHMAFAGTISLRPTTLIAVLHDICVSLARHGFRHVVLLNGHLGGAHPSILAAADEIQLDHPELKLWDVDLNAIAADELLAICDSDRFPHAEELEVAQMLAIRPELVHLEHAVDVLVSPAWHEQISPIGVSVLKRATAAEMRALTPTGILGRATAGTVDKGEAALAAQIERVTLFVQELLDREREEAVS